MSSILYPKKAVYFVEKNGEFLIDENVNFAVRVCFVKTKFLNSCFSEELNDPSYYSYAIGLTASAVLTYIGLFYKIGVEVLKNNSYVQFKRVQILCDLGKEYEPFYSIIIGFKLDDKAFECMAENFSGSLSFELHLEDVFYKANLQNFDLLDSINILSLVVKKGPFACSNISKWDLEHCTRNVAFEYLNDDAVEYVTNALLEVYKVHKDLKI